MSRYTIILKTKAERERAAKYIEAAPTGSRVIVTGGRRTPPQNDRMWAMLTDFAEQLPWHGRRLRADDWKVLFMDALSRELRMEHDAIPNLDGNGFVDIGRSSSDLSKAEMSGMIDLMFEFGARHGVVFTDPTAPQERDG
jgi:hypothetical protein